MCTGTADKNMLSSSSRDLSVVAFATKFAIIDIFRRLIKILIAKKSSLASKEIYKINVVCDIINMLQ